MSVSNLNVVKSNDDWCVEFVSNPTKDTTAFGLSWVTFEEGEDYERMDGWDNTPKALPWTPMLEGTAKQIADKDDELTELYSQGKQVFTRWFMYGCVIQYDVALFRYGVRDIARFRSAKKTSPYASLTLVKRFDTEAEARAYAEKIQR